ncbi:WXG100 family type VII secretion target [Mycolicibacterium lacusdiani]|uniref:WXG100 family type VII secretion target n=1 Tax=Mycolicibacterium lacusdiani TaxID=2895283 RepID=UPI001F328907|nr:WXG100 family type VII secretion target [Mycolicibacterium lacusdiani]
MLVVDFAQLQAAIDHMAKFGQEVTEVLDDVDVAMAALRSTWHGEASDQQAQAQRQWDEGADQMKAALEQLKTIAGAARENYSDAVSKNGQMWG